MIDILLINGFRSDIVILPVGIGYLAEAIEAEGFSYEFCDANLQSDEEIIKAVAEYAPKYVGLGTMTYRTDKNYELLEKIKDTFPETKIILGGPHVIAEDSVIFSKCPAIDILVKGEGEKVLCRILRNEDPHHTIPGVITRDGEGPPPECVETAGILFPKYRKFDLSRYPSHMPLASSRGCVYKCAFCGAPKFLGAKWRAFSADQIINEFSFWYARGYRNFVFADSLFSLNKKRVIAFCDFIIAQNYHDVTFSCEGVRADHLDAPTVAKMKEARFISISIGIESTHDKSLAFLNKGESFSAIDSALRILSEANIDTFVFLIAGIPNESYQDIRASIRYLMRHRSIVRFHITRLTPILGTPYYEFAKNNKLISKESECLYNPDFYDFETPSPWVSANEFRKIKRDVNHMCSFLLRRSYLRRWSERKNIPISLKQLNALSRFPLPIVKILKYATYAFARRQNSRSTAHTAT